MLPALWQASDTGRLPVVCDASSCTEGLDTMRRLAEDPSGPWSALRFVDAVEFAHDRLLPGLTVTAPLGSLALHPTCSSTQLGLQRRRRRGGRADRGRGDVPVDWGCCGFAGDRGLLHPELTASATAREAAEVARRPHDAYASVNRTCELGMTPGHGPATTAPARAAGASDPLTERAGCVEPPVHSSRSGPPRRASIVPASAAGVSRAAISGWCRSKAGRSERIRGMDSKLCRGGGQDVAHSSEAP